MNLEKLLNEPLVAIVALILVVAFVAGIYKLGQNIFDYKPVERAPETNVASESTDSPADDTLKCTKPTESIKTSVHEGLNATGVTIENLRVFKADDGYFVSDELTGDGFSQVATWWTDKLENGLFLSIEHVAAEFSNYPLAKDTRFGFTMETYGARESQECEVES